MKSHLPSKDTSKPTSENNQSEKNKTTANNKDIPTCKKKTTKELLSSDSEVCLDWTDDEHALDLGTENTYGFNADTESESGLLEGYIVIDKLEESVSDVDSEYTGISQNRTDNECSHNTIAVGTNINTQNVKGLNKDADKEADGLESTTTEIKKPGLKTLTPGCSKELPNQYKHQCANENTSNSTQYEKETIQCLDEALAIIDFVDTFVGDESTETDKAKVDSNQSSSLVSTGNNIGKVDAETNASMYNDPNTNQNTAPSDTDESSPCINMSIDTEKEDNKADNDLNYQTVDMFEKENCESGDIIVSVNNLDSEKLLKVNLSETIATNTALESSNYKMDENDIARTPEYKYKVENSGPETSVIETSTSDPKQANAEIDLKVRDKHFKPYLARSNNTVKGSKATNLTDTTLNNSDSKMDEFIFKVEDSGLDSPGNSLHKVENNEMQPKETLTDYDNERKAQHLKVCSHSNDNTIKLEFDKDEGPACNTGYVKEAAYETIAPTTSTIFAQDISKTASNQTNESQSFSVNNLGDNSMMFGPPFQSNQPMVSPVLGSHFFTQPNTFYPGYPNFIPGNQNMNAWNYNSYWNSVSSSAYTPYNSPMQPMGPMQFLNTQNLPAYSQPAPVFSFNNQFMGFQNTGQYPQGLPNNSQTNPTPPGTADIPSWIMSGETMAPYLSNRNTNSYCVTSVQVSQTSTELDKKVLESTEVGRKRNKKKKNMQLNIVEIANPTSSATVSDCNGSLDTVCTDTNIVDTSYLEGPQEHVSEETQQEKASGNFVLEDSSDTVNNDLGHSIKHNIQPDHLWTEQDSKQTQAGNSDMEQKSHDYTSIDSETLDKPVQHDRLHNHINETKQENQSLALLCSAYISPEKEDISIMDNTEAELLSVASEEKIKKELDFKVVEETKEETVKDEEKSQDSHIKPQGKYHPIDSQPTDKSIEALAVEKTCGQNDKISRAPRSTDNSEGSSDAVTRSSSSTCSVVQCSQKPSDTVLLVCKNEVIEDEHTSETCESGEIGSDTDNNSIKHSSIDTLPDRNSNIQPLNGCNSKTDELTVKIKEEKSDVELSSSISLQSKTGGSYEQLVKCEPEDQYTDFIEHSLDLNGSTTDAKGLEADDTNSKLTGIKDRRMQLLKKAISQDKKLRDYKDRASESVTTNTCSKSGETESSYSTEEPVNEPVNVESKLQSYLDSWLKSNFDNTGIKKDEYTKKEIPVVSFETVHSIDTESTDIDSASRCSSVTRVGISVSELDDVQVKQPPLDCLPVTESTPESPYSLATFKITSQKKQCRFVPSVLVGSVSSALSAGKHLTLSVTDKKVPSESGSRESRIDKTSKKRSYSRMTRRGLGRSSSCSSSNSSFQSQQSDKPNGVRHSRKSRKRFFSGQDSYSSAYSNTGNVNLKEDPMNKKEGQFTKHQSRWSKYQPNRRYNNRRQRHKSDNTGSRSFARDSSVDSCRDSVAGQAGAVVNHQADRKRHHSESWRVIPPSQTSEESASTNKPTPAAENRIIIHMKKSFLKERRKRLYMSESDSSTSSCSSFKGRKQRHPSKCPRRENVPNRMTGTGIPSESVPSGSQNVSDAKHKKLQRCHGTSILQKFGSTAKADEKDVLDQELERKRRELDNIYYQCTDDQRASGTGSIQGPNQTEGLQSGNTKEKIVFIRPGLLNNMAEGISNCFPAFYKN